jgi:phosphoglycolate phosphatase-like HAD superfamily hydrolase
MRENGLVDSLGVLDRPFRAIMFDWDGTAVPDRRADASVLRDLLETLSGLGCQLVITSGTHLENVDDQLGVRPAGPGRLFIDSNRGSEIWEIEHAGPVLRERREPRSGENEALDRAAAATVAALSERGLAIGEVSTRLNRRKLDLMPLPEWSDPPKSRIAELLAATLARLREAGIGSLSEVCELARELARAAGVADPRVTTDAKHIEIGLTDKSDAARRIFPLLASLAAPPEQVLVCGDEIGPLGGEPGSDSLMFAGDGARAVAVSVGVEPEGVPPGVIALGGGPVRFLELLRDQIARR